MQRTKLYEDLIAMGIIDDFNNNISKEINKDVNDADKVVELKCYELLHR